MERLVPFTLATFLQLFISDCFAVFELNELDTLISKSLSLSPVKEYIHLKVTNLPIKSVNMLQFTIKIYCYSVHPTIILYYV